MSDERSEDASYFEVPTDASKVVGAPGVPAIVVSVSQNHGKLGISARNLCPNHIVGARPNIGSYVGVQHNFFSCSQPSAKRVADAIGKREGEGRILPVWSIPWCEIQRTEQVGVVNGAGRPVVNHPRGFAFPHRLPSHGWQTPSRKNETSFNVLAIVVLRSGTVTHVHQGRSDIRIAALASQYRLARGETREQLRIRFHYPKFGFTAFP